MEKRFFDVGLIDLAVQSGVIAEGSIDRVFEGFRYNLGVRFHNLVYEALIKLAWKGFPYDDHMALLVDVSQCTDNLKENLCSKSLGATLNDSACKRILDLDHSYLRE